MKTVITRLTSSLLIMVQIYSKANDTEIAALPFTISTHKEMDGCKYTLWLHNTQNIDLTITLYTRN